MADQVRLKLDVGPMTQKLRAAGPRGYAYISKTVKYYSLVAETRSKSTARWTDQTGNARSGLTGESTSQGSYDRGAVFTMVLFHRVNYGIYLESRNFRYKGELGVIEPTIKLVAPQIMRSIQDLFQRMF